MFIPVWPPVRASQYAPPSCWGALTPERQTRHHHVASTGLRSSVVSSSVWQLHKVCHVEGISAHGVVKKYIWMLSRDVI